ETVVAGGYLEETLGWKERVYLVGALRVGGASAFGGAFNSAVYPKASASWFALRDALDGRVRSLRLRAAYGSSGVQPRGTAALAQAQVFPVSVNGALTTGSALQFLGNRNLGPERQRELETGVDAELYRDRI